MKDKGLGSDVLRILEREGMLQRVQFNGEWEEVKKLYPGATDVGDGTVWVQPGVTQEQVKEYHRQGKAVVANFSANDHEMDLAGMRAASLPEWMASTWTIRGWVRTRWARPVERRLHELILLAELWRERLSRSGHPGSCRVIAGFRFRQILHIGYSTQTIMFRGLRRWRW